LRLAKKLDRQYCFERQDPSKMKVFLNEELVRSPNNSFLLCAAEAVARPQPDIKADELVEMVKKRYGSITCMSGRLSRSTIVDGRNAGKVVANFSLISPGKIYINNIEPVESRIVVKEDEYWMTKEGSKDMINRKLSELDPASRAGLTEDGLLKSNPISGMLSGYAFKRIDDYDNHYILKATPINKAGVGKISFILIKIKPADWYVKAIEIYGKDGKMFIQTKFHEFKEFKNGTFFPVHIESRMMISGEKVIEETRYSRLDNSRIKDLSIFKL